MRGRDKEVGGRASTGRGGRLAGLCQVSRSDGQCLAQLTLRKLAVFFGFDFGRVSCPLAELGEVGCCCCSVDKGELLPFQVLVIRSRS